MGLGERNTGAVRAHGEDQGSRGRWHRPARPGPTDNISTSLAFCQSQSEATAKNPHYGQNAFAVAGQSVAAGIKTVGLRAGVGARWVISGMLFLESARSALEYGGSSYRFLRGN